MNQLQQGDVIFKVVGSIPADAVPIASPVIAEGEGHHLHRIANPDAVELFERGGIKYARVKTPTVLEHVGINGGEGEHGAVSLAPDTVYAFGRVREYDHAAKWARRVVD